MNNLSKTKLPPFFNYTQEKTDNGYETMQDFYLSWLIRCADEEYKDANPLIHEYSKNAILFLINQQDLFECKDIVKVKNVKTWRQWKHIDLIAEFDIEINSDVMKYVLNIENKWYSQIRSNQLEKSKEAVLNFYSELDKDSIKNWVIFCDDSILNDEIINHCSGNSYNYTTIGNIQESTGMNKKGLTDNDLFDEYWFWNSHVS